MTKRLTLLSAALLLSIVAFSQTQQGYVRTLGRPNKKGEALEGVIIRVKGEHNTILSDEKSADAWQIATLRSLNQGWPTLSIA